MLEASGHLAVIGNVGMGGIGKTTFAQQIYNDGSLKEQYGYIIFVTVSRSFELRELIKSMLRKLNESEDSMRGDSCDLLRTLHNKLDKKFLSILDHVWGADEGMWLESLKSALPHRAGSCVIVTRDEEVARSMGATHRCYIISDSSQRRMAGHCSLKWSLQEMGVDGQIWIWKLSESR